MLDTNAERAGIEERYEVACNASSLKVEAEKGGPADVLIAAGWARNIGTELMRMHTDVRRPKQFSEDIVRMRAGEIPLKRDRPDMDRARREVVDAMREALRISAEIVVGRSGVDDRLLVWAIGRGIGAGTLRHALVYWLTKGCPVCSGLGKLRMPSAPVLGPSCWKCEGKGEMPKPQMDGASVVLAHLDYCVNVARGSIKKRLRGG
jgi:hypothetical protein